MKWEWGKGRIGLPKWEKAEGIDRKKMGRYEENKVKNNCKISVKDIKKSEENVKVEWFLKITEIKKMNKNIKEE